MDQPFDPEVCSLRFALFLRSAFSSLHSLLQPGAFGFRLSNPPVLQCAALLGSLEVFEEAGGMEKLRAKSILLTAYLEALLLEKLGQDIHIFTPKVMTFQLCLPFPLLFLRYERTGRATAWLSAFGQVLR